MAEFRKLFYALGLAAMLAGVSSTASAQTTICNSNAGVPPIIREESFADLVGDYVLDCTGGASTAAGVSVPQVNVTVTLSVNITSKILTSGEVAGNFSEALLLMDEPNSSIHPAIPLLACGQTGAPDNSVSGRGVCGIVSTGNFAQTYDGTPNGTAVGTCDTSVYGCGRPNVYQGRQGFAQNQGNTNIIVFNGVPFDPPGVGAGTADDPAVRHRFMRITNIRANSPPVAGGFLLQTVIMNVNINGSTTVAINNPSQTVASVQRGIQAPVTGSVVTFVQCVASSDTPTVRFREGFASSFKVKGLEQTLENGTYDGTAIRYNGDTGYTFNGDNVRQNVPGASYNTESGFLSPSSYVNPSPNPPLGIGNIPTTGGAAISNSTGIANAGIATQGTRIAVTFRDLPNGLTMTVPGTVNLVRAGTTTVTGVAVRTAIASARGDGPFSALGSVGLTSDMIVYEVLFSDPTAIEDLVIPVTVSYPGNQLSSDLPEVNKTAQVSGGFAPFILSTDSANTWGQARAASATVGSSLPLPRFRTQSAYQDLFRVIKCSCNLLFPFVSNAASTNGNFDTGIALANTSLTPGSASTVAQRFGFTNTAQEGPVQFWYYPANATDPPVATQCTNTAATGVCPGTKSVKAGETLLYVLSSGSSAWGLKGAPGFTGYMIAQASFQYCHAFAYISPQGATPLTNGMSVGYLALSLDKQVDGNSGTYLPSRTSVQGEQLAH